MDVSIRNRVLNAVALLLSMLIWAPPTQAQSGRAVTIVSPAAGAVVGGMIAVYAQANDSAADDNTADDNTEVAGVQFMLNGADLGPEDTSVPYSITWNTEARGDGTHTLTALARDAAGRISYSAPISVTVANKPAPRMIRIEETDPAVIFGDNWNPDTGYGPWSGGSAKYNVYNAGAGAYATFTFTGTGVSWIGYRGRYGGFVRVYIDGALTAELDTYRTEEEIAAPVYTITGLTAGTHSLMIELTGQRNSAALASETAVDAFDVMP